jgi:hypothetical protein
MVGFSGGGPVRLPHISGIVDSALVLKYSNSKGTNSDLQGPS